jgi:translocation and assembly module TamA
MRGRPRAAAVGLAAAVLLFGCAGESRPGEPLSAEAGSALPTLPPIPYAVDFEGNLPAELAGLLPQVVDSASQSQQPPTSRLAIRQRAERDVPRLQQVLRAHGYFDATVTFRIEDPKRAPSPGIVTEVERLATRPEAIVVFDVQSGPLYRFGKLQVVLADNPDGFEAPQPPGLVAGEPALTQAVLDAEQKLLVDARQDGFALAKTGEREVIVDHDTRLMDVTLHLDPGRRARFGEVTFSGGDGIDFAFLRGRVPFEAGQRYDPTLVEESQKDLFDSNLFSTIVVRPADRLTADDRLNIAYDLRQRPPRSIGAELNYETDIGPGGRVFWEHRNIFGAGERLRAELAASELQQSFTTSLTKPDFLRPRQNLLVEATLQRARLDAYDSDSLGTGVSVERELSKQLKVSLGTAFRYARIQTPKDPEETFGLLSFPGKVDWDFANDQFSPTSGGTLLVTGAPYTNLIGPSLNFVKGRLTNTRYIQLLPERRLILALRGSVGSLVGASRAEVPADERFYAGGGGSIRGIGFQLAGPLDNDDKPLGGRSVVEGSIELRTRWRNNFGAALFLDGGTVDSSVFPSAQERVLFGAGPGLRYFTPIGPARVDLGFPLDRRKGVDAPWQLYFSLGQAF